MRRIRRDQSVSSATQRPVVREPLMGSALATDRVFPPAERRNDPAALTAAAWMLHLRSSFLHIGHENDGCVGGTVEIGKIIPGNEPFPSCLLLETRLPHCRLRTVTPPVLRNYTCEPAITA